MKTLGSIESFTGGLFASTIVNKPGASKYFKGTLVTYSSELKEKLNIDTSKGVINKETALAMAQAGKEFLNVDFCVAFTGNAGPTSQEGKPVGCVYIAINEEVYKKHFKGSRNAVRKKAVNFALKKLESLIERY